MTNKVIVSYPSRTRQTYVSRSCPPSVSYGDSTVSGDFTDIVISSNSPRVNGKLSLRQNSLSRLRIRYPPPIYEIIQETGGECPTISNYWYPAYLTADPNYVDIFPGLHSDDMDTATQKALLSFLGKINTTKANIAQIIAERQQTIDLVTSNVLQLVGIYRDLRRGRNPFTSQRLLPAGSKSKEMANRWLEFSYGWVPLVSDVYALLELKDMSPPHGLIKAKGKVISSKSYKSVPKGSPFDSMESFSTEQRTRSATCTIRAMVTLDNPNLTFATSVGLTNPALLTWELLPYSFVVDWFLPVGSWLEAQNALLGVTLTDVSTTKTSRFYGTTTVRTSVKPGVTGVFGGGRGQGFYSQVNKERTLTVPPLSFPKLQNPLSVGHALNALALLRQLF